MLFLCRQVSCLIPAVVTAVAGASAIVRGAPIENYEPLALLTFLKHLRVSDEQKVLPKVAHPNRNSDWHNLLGMRFSPVPNTNSVLFGTREVTEFEYQQFLNDTKQGTAQTEGNNILSLKPAIVSRKEAVAFCKWLTDKDRFREHLDAVMGYRLPSEREVQTLRGFV